MANSYRVYYLTDDIAGNLVDDIDSDEIDYEDETEPCPFCLGREAAINSEPKANPYIMPQLEDQYEPSDWWLWESGYSSGIHEMHVDTGDQP